MLRVLGPWQLTTRYIGNTALIAPKGYCPDVNLPPQGEAPKFLVPPTQLRDAFFKGLEKEPRFAFKDSKVGVDGKLSVGLIQRSLIFQFPDVSVPKEMIEANGLPRVAASAFTYL